MPRGADHHMIDVTLLVRDVVKHLGAVAFELLQELGDLPFAIPALP